MAKKVRITMGVQGFLAAALREGVVAELRTERGEPVGVFRAARLPDGGEADVVARTLPGGEACELEGETLLGQLFLSVLAAGAL
jgi:hypothetical protein